MNLNFILENNVTSSTQLTLGSTTTSAAISQLLILPRGLSQHFLNCQLLLFCCCSSIDFVCGEDLQIFVMIPEENEVPAWLTTGFEKLDDQMPTKGSSDPVFDIWMKSEVDRKGDKVMLGGAEYDRKIGGGKMNYFAAVKRVSIPSLDAIIAENKQIKAGWASEASEEAAAAHAADQARIAGERAAVAAAELAAAEVAAEEARQRVLAEEEAARVAAEARIELEAARAAAVEEARQRVLAAEEAARIATDIAGVCVLILSLFPNAATSSLVPFPLVSYPIISSLNLNLYLSLSLSLFPTEEERLDKEALEAEAMEEAENKLVEEELARLVAEEEARKCKIKEERLAAERAVNQLQRKRVEAEKEKLGDEKAKLEAERLAEELKITEEARLQVRYQCSEVLFYSVYTPGNPFYPPLTAT